MNTSATASASSPVIATAASLRSQSLAKGAIGDALLHVERARSGSGTWQAVHAALTATTRYPLIATVDASLFFGTPAVGFVLHTAAVGTCRYTGALHTLDAQVRTLTRKRLDQAHARIDRGERPRTAEFDLFYGITGLGAYLLLRDPASANLHDVLSYLVRLTVPLTGDDAQLPLPWRSRPAAHHPSCRPRRIRRCFHSSHPTATRLAPHPGKRAAGRAARRSHRFCSCPVLRRSERHPGHKLGCLPPRWLTTPHLAAAPISAPTQQRESR